MAAYLSAQITGAEPTKYHLAKLSTRFGQCIHHTVRQSMSTLSSSMFRGRQKAAVGREMRVR